MHVVVTGAAGFGYGITQNAALASAETGEVAQRCAVSIDGM